MKLHAPVMAALLSCVPAPIVHAPIVVVIPSAQAATTTCPDAERTLVLEAISTDAGAHPREDPF